MRPLEVISTKCINTGGPAKRIDGVVSALSRMIEELPSLSGDAGEVPSLYS